MAATLRGVTASSSHTTPPAAASTGTVSWTTAAEVAVCPESAAYQMA